MVIEDIPYKTFGKSEFSVSESDVFTEISVSQPSVSSNANIVICNSSSCIEII